MRTTSLLFRASLFALALPSFFACKQADATLDGGPAPLPPGYDGPYVPNGDVQQGLRALEGRRITDETGALGGGELTIVAPFSVTPNPITGKGPNALLSRDGTTATAIPMYGKQGQDGYYWIAFGSDADCADLSRRAGVEPKFNASGKLSEVYRRALGLDGAAK